MAWRSHNSLAVDESLSSFFVFVSFYLLFISVFFFRVFFLSCLFSFTSFFWADFLTYFRTDFWTDFQTDQLIIDSCPSSSDSIISLSYSMANFSANLFGLLKLDQALNCAVFVLNYSVILHSRGKNFGKDERTLLFSCRHSSKSFSMLIAHLLSKGFQAAAKILIFLCVCKTNILLMNKLKITVSDF